MGIDRKYGRVTFEKGTIGEDEPVVVFRAQDKLLIPLLLEYYDKSYENRSPKKHLDGIEENMKAIREWQDKNRTQIPRSD